MPICGPSLILLHPSLTCRQHQQRAEQSLQVEGRNTLLAVQRWGSEALRGTDDLLPQPVVHHPRLLQGPDAITKALLGRTNKKS
ncbi:hypothetical protein E2C01_026888 [Portunus trituberculatus]|uniref:Uncharacterized protein n=1 Tax=Portunus trituberculatus TaxID=210409 RepID=A0A5B7EJD8_PORTR|nr:hypothetical protein [Portunus trituberculatus]